MTKYLVGLLFLSACSQSSEVATQVESENFPPGTVFIDYPDIEGLQKAIIKNGSEVLEEGDVKNENRHGTWTAYYPTGKIKTITSYLDGQKQGPEIQFDNSGYVTSRAPYVSGLLEGEYRAYSRGRVMERKRYVNGQLQGLVQKYYPNGTIMEESYYDEGVIDGEAKWYNEDGVLTIRYQYEKGELKSQDVVK